MPSCDYRKPECINDGVQVLGTWVCRQHLGSLPHIQQAVQRASPVPAPAATLDATPWPLRDVLRVLVDAADHLLEEHDCDSHGHERVRLGIAQAERYLPHAISLLGREGESDTATTLIARVNALAHVLCRAAGHGVPAGYTFYNSPSPRGQHYWRLAVLAYEHITGAEVAQALETLHANPVPLGEGQGEGGTDGPPS